jgi:hypothetical protein
MLPSKTAPKIMAVESAHVQNNAKITIFCVLIFYLEKTDIEISSFV